MPSASLVRSADCRSNTGTVLKKKLKVDKQPNYDKVGIEPHSFDEKLNSPHLNKLTLIDSN